MSDFHTIIPYQPFRSTHFNFKNYTGRTFNHLTVYGIYGRASSSNAVWLCLCDCGNWVAIAGGALAQGGTVSCGHAQAELARQARFLHGESKQYTTEYGAYRSARQRCNTTTHHAYKDYGGRGVEFRFQSYMEFLDHIGRKPTPKHTLDRIDNDGHYELGNVKWSTMKEQCNNRRKPKKRFR